MELTEPRLVWEPAPEDENARLGPDASALLDYLRVPPAGTPPPCLDAAAAQHQARRDALRALIEAALR